MENMEICSYLVRHAMTNRTFIDAISSFKIDVNFFKPIGVDLRNDQHWKLTLRSVMQDLMHKSVLKMVKIPILNHCGNG